MNFLWYFSPKSERAEKGDSSIIKGTYVIAISIALLPLVFPTNINFTLMDLATSKMIKRPPLVGKIQSSYKTAQKVRENTV